MAEQGAIAQSTLFDAGPRVKKCSTCQETKPVDQFALKQDCDGKKRLNHHCNECRRDYKRREYAKNPELVRIRNKKWLDANPDKVVQIHRRSHLKKTYGVTQAQYDVMFEAQNGLCAICGGTEVYRHPRSGEIVPLSIDHDHATGQIRALLCHRCNTSVGKFKEDPALLRAAADYLERHRKLHESGSK